MMIRMLNIMNSNDMDFDSDILCVFDVYDWIIFS